MRKQIQLWGSRFVLVALVIAAGQRWGYPAYKQYFTQKKVTAYVPTTKVSEGPFVVSFHEMGTLKAERSVPITVSVEGKIIELVPEGRVVKAGDKIAEIDTTELRREIRSKQLSLKNAEADVQRVKAELEILKAENRTKIAKAEADLEFAKEEFKAAAVQAESKKELAVEKLIPRTEAERAEIDRRAKELAVKKGEMDLELQRKDVESKESQKQADVRTREFARDMARYDLEDVERRIKDAVITAPTSGMVVLGYTHGPDGRRKIKSGDQPWRRQPLGDLPDLTSMQAIISVGESDAPKLRVGMETLIRLEAVQRRVFQGVVREISSLASEKEPWESGATPGKKNFEVTVQILKSEPKTLKPGMTADAEFIIERVAKAVYVPIESVIEKDGETWVYVKNGKKWIKTSVVTGDYNDNFVCIKRGLMKGEVIALRDPTRPLEQQESGSNAPGASDKDAGTQPPLPAAVKK